MGGAPSQRGDRPLDTGTGEQKRPNAPPSCRRRHLREVGDRLWQNSQTLGAWVVVRAIKVLVPGIITGNRSDLNIDLTMTILYLLCVLWSFLR